MAGTTFGINESVTFQRSNIDRKFITPVDNRFMTNICSAKPEVGKLSYIELSQAKPEQINTSKSEKANFVQPAVAKTVAASAQKENAQEINPTVINFKNENKEEVQDSKWDIDPNSIANQAPAATKTAPNAFAFVG